MKKRSIFNKCLLGGLCIWLTSCNFQEQKQEEIDLTALKIVSSNGTISEILTSIGLEDKIVGVDVTSTYPSSLQEKAKIGHNRNINVEGVLELGPSLFLASKKDLKPEAIMQLQQSGVKVIQFDIYHSVEGARNLIKSVTDSLKLQTKGDSLLQILDTQLAEVKDYPKQEKKTKVLFIYARGAGTMMVAGKGTQVHEMIQLAGGVNVASDIDDFKPLTPESLVAYNPEAILLFDSGLNSLGNEEGILQLPGVMDTDAGKNRNIIHMDGQLLSGFSPRVAMAIKELHEKIQ